MAETKQDLSFATACQLVADFFGNKCYGIDYSELKNDPPCWNGFVHWVAEAGLVLEEVATGRQFDYWYDVLEGCSQVLADHIRERSGEPDMQFLREKFRKIVEATT